MTGPSAPTIIGRGTRDGCGCQIMTGEMHSASRTILATARAVFRTHVDPEVLLKWRAPPSMSARLTEFDARPGGGYRMELRYADGASRGKSTADSDIVRVRFLDLVPDDLIVERAEDVPASISAADHRQGIESSLRNLALLLE